jgi:hypothetical protein
MSPKNELMYPFCTKATSVRASRAKQKPPLPRLAQTPLCPYLAAASRARRGDPDRAIILA